MNFPATTSAAKIDKHLSLSLSQVKVERTNNLCIQCRQCSIKCHNCLISLHQVEGVAMIMMMIISNVGRIWEGIRPEITRHLPVCVNRLRRLRCASSNRKKTKIKTKDLSKSNKHRSNCAAIIQVIFLSKKRERERGNLNPTE